MQGGRCRRVVEYLAEQLQVADAPMATYSQRQRTRLEHRCEIAREIGYLPMASLERLWERRDIDSRERALWRLL